ncbi:hypothetical protein BS50DRAFT_404307 [Corynespora cassiicola Philippines]|uniref:Uncharacterized protein n=1 Tax=Corynespora cassiicola Philippines TaxID=1448308 RepID=A0A2T2NKR9_CORCC|nr:hypothetical protein BS50DRAFT_404307 [Corynespora cassiicola Philippines]
MAKRKRRNGPVASNSEDQNPPERRSSFRSFLNSITPAFLRRSVGSNSRAQPPQRPQTAPNLDHVPSCEDPFDPLRYHNNGRSPPAVLVRILDQIGADGKPCPYDPDFMYSFPRFEEGRARWNFGFCPPQIRSPSVNITGRVNGMTTEAGNLLDTELCASCRRHSPNSHLAVLRRANIAKNSIRTAPGISERFELIEEEFDPPGRRPGRDIYAQLRAFRRENAHLRPRSPHYIATTRPLTTMPPMSPAMEESFATVVSLTEMIDIARQNAARQPSTRQRSDGSSSPDQRANPEPVQGHQASLPEAYARVDPLTQPRSRTPSDPPPPYAQTPLPHHHSIRAPGDAAATPNLNPRPRPSTSRDSSRTLSPSSTNPRPRST